MHEPEVDHRMAFGEPGEDDGRAMVVAAEKVRTRILGLISK